MPILASLDVSFKGPSHAFSMNSLVPSVMHCDCLNTHKAQPCANTLHFKDLYHLRACNEANTIGSILKPDGLGSMLLTWSQLYGRLGAGRLLELRSLRPVWVTQ